MQPVDKGVIGILLAAGRSRRFGSDKLLHPLDGGRTIGQHAAEHLRAGVDAAIAVVGPDTSTELRQRLAEAGLHLIENPAAASGMASSISVGVETTPTARGWIVALGDMPWIAPTTVRAVATQLNDGARLVAPCYRGRRGHPVGFAAPFADALRALQGDQGARTLLRTHAADLQLLEVYDPGILVDIDCHADLALVRAGVIRKNDQGPAGS